MVKFFIFTKELNLWNDNSAKIGPIVRRVGINQSATDAPFAHYDLCICALIHPLYIAYTQLQSAPKILTSPKNFIFSKKKNQSILYSIFSILQTRRKIIFSIILSIKKHNRT